MIVALFSQKLTIVGGGQQNVTPTFFSFLKHRFNAFGSIKSCLPERLQFKMYIFTYSFHISKHVIFS